MSRTDKDMPFRVRELNSVRDGDIRHDHTGFYTRKGNGKPQRKGVISSKAFYPYFFMPHEGKELKAYREYLNYHGIDFDEEETTQKIIRDTKDYVQYSAGNGVYRILDYFRWEHTSENKFVKGILITPYKIIERVLYSDLCSTPETLYFDGRFWRDSRDGLRAACAPPSAWRYGDGRKKSDSYHRPRSRARQAARQAVKDYHAGVMDESYDSISLYVDEIEDGWCCKYC